LVTTDQNLKYQQNLASRRIAIIVMSSTSWPRIQKVLPSIVEAVGNIKANGYIEVKVP
jgi:coenzyme F420-reducing hydrogenase delta subunit